MYALKFTGITDYLHLVKSERPFPVENIQQKTHRVSGC
jgi:hypothetical protein